ncbi:hypothetical protein J504_0395 [Acinetobacter baumannii 348935]|nr:hypothetical protein J504_0395 [Acinetobacter baumannii 348935]
MTKIHQIQNRKIGQLANFLTEKMSLAAMQGFFLCLFLGKPLARTTVRKARFHVQLACQFLFLNMVI